MKFRGFKKLQACSTVTRGWIGVFVSTSYYYDTVQKEVLADRYPIILINGKKLVEIITTYMHKTGEKKIENFLRKLTRLTKK